MINMRLRKKFRKKHFL